MRRNPCPDVTVTAWPPRWAYTATPFIVMALVAIAWLAGWL